MAAGGTLAFKNVGLFDGERSLDGPRSVLVCNGKITTIEMAPGSSADDRVVTGGFLFPGFVDAHVHLSFFDAEAMVRGGVTAALDLGEPVDYAFATHAPLRFRAAGPLITAPGGYPTRSWGANGFGLEVTGPKTAREAVAMLADRGAAIVKVAIEPGAGPVLDEATLKAVADAAHDRGLKAAAHALGVASVRAAATAGIDVLAHTPIEPLPEDLVGALGRAGVTVISTVRAFGARSTTRENLTALVAAGCPVAYGTDLGNDGIEPGIDPEELEILEHALGGRDAALAAATTGAAELAGGGGRIAVGAPADLVWVPAFASFGDLRRDLEVWVGGGS